MIEKNMLIRLVISFFSFFSLLGLLTACGASEDVNKDSCSSQADCGGPGQGLCLDGECLRFDDDTGYAKAVMALSFGRDMYQSAASSYIYFFDGKMSDGGSLSCEDLLDSQILVDSEKLNQLTAEPKYLVFNWSLGGTFFPNNLVQFIRPSEDAVVFVDCFSQLNGKGVRTALGCKDGIGFHVEQTSEFTVQISSP